MEYVSSLEQLKSNKINTVLFYFQYKNKIKQSSFEKHKEFLLNEIKYYCKFDKYQARDVYDIIVGVIKIIENMMLISITNVHYVIMKRFIQ